ncbi:MAG: ABC transporter ATP-binding protein [Desulfobacterales bacterium]|nr:ABC transporter ATP-binding protein [Desulfobacterales bacterium]MCF8079593.1 ABC transporter ATP-binding protein [Desulfobacterales bacterium]
MALLEAEHLSIGYRTRNGLLRAVEDVSFSLELGGSLGFVGESGCGKTTIGMALMGLLPANGSIVSGALRFKGQNLVGISDERLRKLRWKEIAMIFQAAMNALNPIQRVGDQIVEAIRLHEPEVSAAQAAERVRSLFSLVDLDPERSRDYPHQYSGGMKQRAIIAMALACRPDVIIADEPTTALDVIVQAQILAEIRRVQKEMDVAVLFISHDIAVVAEVCRHIAVMYAGQIVEQGTREEVFETPAHPYTQALLDAYLTIEEEDAALPQAMKGETPNLIVPQKGCRFYDRCPHADAQCRQEPPTWISLSPTHKVLCYGPRS